jgi:hypothetical protein
MPRISSGCRSALSADVVASVVGAGGTPRFGGHVPLRAISPHIAGGEEVATPYDHPSLLRTIEDAFGISSHLNNAGAPTEHAMTHLFAR